MNDVYILLTDTGSILTRLIKRVTKSPYNHVSISFDEDLESVYSFGRKNPYNPFIGGFVRESIYSGTFKRFKNTTCMVLKFQVPDDEYEMLKSNINFFINHREDYVYNLKGLALQYFKKNQPRKNAYFCSEFVADVLYQSNLTLWDIPPHMVRPYDFGEDDRFELVFEGRLDDYATRYDIYKTI